ncbi:sugar-binding transcriptional regulator [Clostridium autoethanogenum]|uniref:Sugar-binding transcriptional regulator n=1 Tax=Clostridium autoethanogenum DSM 10061 TaxID=1341692 RepID=A0ABN4BB17_9CLOT|nr:sugar-binding transcriptional regulator [Clostridium autoethanogenum]AGY74709.1 sugar-binding transcriptional regulator [Clostridium autoethanogenum DSM 10061]ALU34890.1 Sorbitol operon regulator [Clostridium autoethanogenum DSM 10061]OVY51720.1 Sorbitol operon regulator [Clostridium autoethanogenum]
MIDEFEKINEAERLNFLAELSDMYYELNMTQSEIANKLSTTRFKVSKLLQEARDKHVVEITINKPHSRVPKLENILKENFDLKDALVLDNKMLAYEETLSTLGKLGAQYVDDLISENSIVGVLWGKTLLNLIKNLKPKKKLPITTVQMVGSAAKDNTIVDSQELMRRMAKIYGGKCKYLYAPLYVDNDYARKALMHEPVLSDTIFFANKSDIILTGVGTTDAMFSSSLWANYLERVKQYNLDDLKAVGCIYGRVYNDLGEEVDIDINQKVIGIDTSAIRQANHVIGIAAGKFKAKAILGAIRGKYINTLITDDATASKILSLAKIQF